MPAFTIPASYRVFLLVILPECEPGIQPLGLADDVAASVGYGASAYT